ncbi:MAG: sulfatase [Bacteroidetes bacterium]|nr:sulfatase [Bacteroidota bacterium]
MSAISFIKGFIRTVDVMLPRVGWVVLGATVILCDAACRPSEQVAELTPPPNVLLVTIDTIRADHCSTYGYERLTTPTLSHVAEAGVLFRNAYAPMATTGPSHATLLTSLYPRTHGFVKNGLILDSEAQTLSEIMLESGYQTAAVVSSFPLAAKFGFDQGFGHFDDAFEGHGGEPRSKEWEGMVVKRHFDRDALVTTEKASDWLRLHRPSGKPFLLWVHYFDPHTPYNPAESHRQLFLERTGDDPVPGSLEHTVALYDAEIRETDDALGRLLKVVDEEGLADTTVLVIAGDHGEGLMQHGHMEHGVHLYEEAVRVPLIFSWPGNLTAGIEVWEPVQLLDVMPTLLEITGAVGSTSGQQGQSLAGVMTGRQRAEPERPVFLERRRYRPRRVGGSFVTGSKLGIRSGSWKYIEADEEGTRELFDLKADPLEMTNVVERHPEVAARLSQAIGIWLDTTPAVFSSSDTLVSEEDAKMLEALGYVE